MLYCDRKEEEMTAAKEGGVQLSHLTLATTEILTDASDVEVARGGDGMGQRRDGGPLSLSLDLACLSVIGGLGETTEEGRQQGKASLPTLDREHQGKLRG